MPEMHPFGSGSHAPLDDPNEMPECYPIKGNTDSMKYHRPDSRSYGATVAEVWFAAPSIAEAAGFGLAGSHPKDVSSADFEPGQAGHPCTAADLTEMGVTAVAHPFGPGSHVPLRDPREMPDCYIIKGNADSMLYHRPDSANYGATIAEVWFISPSVAEAAGFTLSNTHPDENSSADFEPGASDNPCSLAQLRELGLGAVAQPYGLGSHALLDDPRAMPECYPIKGNVDSMLYHRPDSANYGATVAEVWFVSPSIAEAAGFGLSSTHPTNSSSADFEPGGSGHTCRGSDLISLGLGSLVHPFGPSSRAPLANVREMPECYPIKGNVDSMLYHRPDSANYGATVAEVWFVSPSAAEAAGFAMSTTHPKGSSSADFELGGTGHPCSAVQFGDLIMAGAAAATAGTAVAGAGDSGAAAGGGATGRGVGAGVGGDADDTTTMAQPLAAGLAASEADADAGGGEDGRGIGKAIAGAAAGAAVAGIASVAGAFRGDEDDTTDAAAAADAAEKAAMEKAAAAKAGADKAAVEKAAVEKAAVEKAAVEKAAVEKAAVEKAAVEKAAADKAAAEKAAVEKAAADKAAADKAAAATSVAAMADLGDDETVAGKGAADIRATVQMAAAGGDEPFGPGSHAPFADVHEMPACHPIKGNADSMKYHRPDSQGYPKTKAEVWFVSPSVAEAAGFTLAGSHPEGSSSADFEPGGSGHPCTVEQVVGLGLPGGVAAAAGVVTAGAAAAGAGASAADDVNIDDTVRIPAAASAELQPFGLGSHAPLGDVQEMPACHPIKGNADSMKYHRPDSQGYQQTKAEVWFVSPSVAEAAGFALAGSHPDGSSSADFEPGGSEHPCTAEQLHGLGLGALGFVAGAGALAGAAALAGDGTGQEHQAGQGDKAGQGDEAGHRGEAGDGDDERGLGKTAAMAAAGAGVAAVAGVASLLGDDDDDQTISAAQAAAQRATEAQAKDPERTAAGDKDPERTAAGDKAAGDKAAGDTVSEDVDEDGIGKGAVAAGAAGAAALGAAALLGRDDDDTATGAGAIADPRETIRTEAVGARDTIDDTAGGVGKGAAAAAGAVGAAGVAGAVGRETIDDDTAGGVGKGAAAAAGAVGAAGVAAAVGRETIGDDTAGGTGKGAASAAPAGARETIDDDTAGGVGKGAAAAAGVAGLAGAAALAGRGAADGGKAAGGAAAGKVAAGVGAASAAGAAGAARLGGIGGGGPGGGGGDDDRGAAGAGRFGWLKWLLPLLLLAILLALLLALCGGGSDGGVAVPADPTAVPATAVPATEEPEPTAEPEAAPDPTATAEPELEPTPEPTPEPAPDPTATPEPEPAPACAALAPTLDENGFTTLLTGITAAGLGDTLSDMGPLTLFAPTDEAFAAVPADITTALLADTDLLGQVLKYHVVPSAVMSGDLTSSGVVTLNGASLAIRTDGAAPMVNASGFSATDLSADACVIHGLDSVLVPPSLLTTLGVASLNDAVGGQAITFVDGTADFTDADSATLQAICNLVSTSPSTDGFPPVTWQSSGDADVDAQRAAAIEDLVAGCGPGGLTLDQLAAKPSFTG